MTNQVQRFLSPAYSILLGGLKHSGKTSVGQQLSSMLKADWVDLDDVITKTYLGRTGDTIPDGVFPPRHMVSTLGAEGFQALEAEVLHGFLAQKSEQADDRMPDAGLQLLSLGGGTLSNPRIHSTITTYKPGILFIDGDEEVLYGRIRDGGLPAFLEGDDPRERWSRIYARRRRDARRLADMIIEVKDESIDDIVQKCLITLEEYIHGRK
ncbi:shikimate kinase [Spirochaeta lutea]|uniref:Shikimate kinase n=1 Tax=Spirochaeta lutea TaxID=1480694 RepID=A0A098QZN1_9SPIO|nr:shikimate kinase [Spirochaeta lutea]KGE73174.1 hypothetical protein DC28_05200 [Spirochaeta lutea]